MLSGYRFFIYLKIFPVDTWDEAGLLGMAGGVLHGTLHPPSCPLGKYLSNATIHIDPATESGTDYYHDAGHSQEGLHPHLP